MSIDVQFFGAAGEVTGSCHLVQVGPHKVLLDCGLIQGRAKDEARNHEPFSFDPGKIDAVILSHAHIDHSGRIPLLVKAGFRGPIYTHRATRALCRIMLKDAGFINEKETEWENRKRARKGLRNIEPLFTVDDAKFAMHQFKGLDYNTKKRVLPGITLRLVEAGHILGSSIVELWLEHNGERRKLVFSGDLGRSGMPILRNPEIIKRADLVIMESTYGDRVHRSWESTQEEIGGVLNSASHNKGNIIIPAFAVERTQELLYLFAKYYKEWNLNRWQIFLDSPLAIEATEVFARHTELFNADSANMWHQHTKRSMLPNFHFSRTANQSMALNRIQSGAIIIAGSGMCTGGRIKHHLKHNIWRRECHIIIAGFQTQGTLGRMLVDGAKHIRLWGETIRVSADIHTIGGLSAHADQAGLIQWYSQFEHKPPVVLVHGEALAQQGLAERLRKALAAPVSIAQLGQKIDLFNIN